MLSPEHQASLRTLKPAQLVIVAREAMRGHDAELATAALLLLPRSERRRVRRVLEREGRA